MDFLFIDTGPSEIIRRLTTPPPAYVQPLEVTPPPTLFALACRGYIEGTAPNSCPQTPRGPSGIGITGGVSSPDAPPPREEGLDDSILDGDAEEALLCYLEQNEEKALDALVKQITNRINALNNAIEHGTFIVKINGRLIALNITSGDGNRLPLGNLYSQFGPLRINDTHVVAFVHSHPATPNLTGSSVADDLFVNSFPSDNDYIAYDDFANNAVAFGANDTSWRDEFSAYIIAPDGSVREFEEFSQPADQNFSQQNGGVPKIGTSDRKDLQNRLNDAELDAKGTCQ